MWSSQQEPSRYRDKHRSQERSRNEAALAEGYARLTGVEASVRVRYLDDPHPHQTHVSVTQEADFDDVNMAQGA